MNRFTKMLLESGISEDEQELIESDSIYGEIEDVEMENSPANAKIMRVAQEEYVITLDELCLVEAYLMQEDSTIDIVRTHKTVALENGIDNYKQLTVVIPSQETYDAFVESCIRESKGSTNPASKEKSKGKIKNIKAKITELKTNGIKLKKEKVK